MTNINIFALGGQDENGKNSLVVEVDDDIFVINTGLKVPINNKNGIDGIIPEFKYLLERKERVKGIFLTHAHDETFAALPWLLIEMRGLVIYGSKFTIDVAKDRVSKYKLGHNDFKFEVIENTDLKFGKVTVKTFALANSIPGSLAYNLQTPNGDILVISNMVNDDLNAFGKTDIEYIKNNSKNILALCLDSRIANYHGSSKDKKSVKPFIEKELQKAKSDERIIVGAYDEEMFNLHEIIELAAKYGRPVISYGRNFDFQYNIIRTDAKINLPEFIDYQKIQTTNNAVVLITGSWSRLYQRFVRIAENNDVFLKLRSNDRIIMMAPPINGMEVEYSETLDQVAKSSPNIFDLSENDLCQLRPAKQDIKDLVSILKPQYFFPISALYRYLVTSQKIAATAGVTKDRTIILTNGKIAHFIDGKLASQKARLKDFGDVLIDGFGVGDISMEVIKERKALANGGLISIAFNFNKAKKEIVGEPVLQLVGVCTKNEMPRLQELVRTIVMQKIEEEERIDFKELQNNIRKKVQKVMLKNINKEPLVVTTINEI